MVPGLQPHRTTLNGDTHGFAEVARAGLLEHVHGCCLPARYHARVRASVQKKASSPLLPGRCGSCFKCAREEIILQALGLRPRDEALQAHSVDRLRKLAEEQRVGGGQVDPLSYVLDHDELQRWADTDWPVQLRCSL
jgi:hypothetical protein